jgi:hypothetical protein
MKLAKIQAFDLPRGIKSARQSRAGMLLVECMVYLALLLLVLAGASVLFFRSWDTSLGLRRTMDDLSATLKAGERWRQDVRSAAEPPRSEKTEDGEYLFLPQKTGVVVYCLRQEMLWRSTGENTPWNLLLGNIKSSRMLEDRRHQTAAWRWELELNTRRKSARLRPLFTFEAVPAGTTEPHP